MSSKASKCVKINSILLLFFSCTLTFVASHVAFLGLLEVGVLHQDTEVLTECDTFHSIRT